MKPNVFVQVTAGKNYQRLPSLIFNRFRGKVFLEFLINRLRQVNAVGEIYLLFSDRDENKKAFSWAESVGLNAISGPESPFLRLLSGCKEVSGENFVRVPGEYILLNPAQTEDMITSHVDSGAEYTEAKGFPLGMVPPDIFSKSALNKVFAEMKEGERGHSAALLFKKYSCQIQTTEYRAEQRLAKKGLYFALESEGDVKILATSKHDFSRELLLPEEEVRWLEQTKKDIGASARAQRYSFQKLTLSSTNRCNLRCRMCSIVQNPQKFSLSERCMEDALNFAVKEGFNEVEISGGEPLLLEYVPRLLSDVDTGDTTVRLVTNGLLLKDSFIEKLMEKNIVVQVSIDGFEGSHDFIRGAPGAYKKTMRVIEKLLEKKIPVVVHSVIQKSNVHEIFELFRLFYEKKLQNYSLALVERMKNIHSEDLDEQGLHVVNREFDKIAAFLKTEGKEKNALRYEKLKKVYLKRSEGAGFVTVKGGGCNVPYRSVIVNPDGSVVPCWHYPWNFPEEVFNVNKKSLSEIVHSSGYRERIFDVKRGKCPGCNTLCYGWDDDFAGTIFS
ncbi:MAG: radical SAM protein [Nitrospinota bacterium]